MIYLKLFGRPEISRAGEQPIPLDRTTSAELLIYIADKRTVSRDDLCEIFWPESMGELGRHSLSNALYRLRKIYPDCVETRGDVVTLMTNVEVDVHEFERRAARQDPSVLELYAGPFVADWSPKSGAHFGQWLDRRRAKLANSLRVTVNRQVTHLTEKGALEEALSYGQQAVGREPGEDDFHFNVLKLLVETGQVQEAFRRYESYRDYLAESGLEPVDVMREFIAKLREQHPPPPVRVEVRASPAIELATVRAEPRTAPALVVRSRWPRVAVVALVLLAVGGYGVWAARSDAETLSDAALLPGMVAILPMAELASANAPVAADSLRRRLSADLRRNPYIQIADLERTDREARARSELTAIAASLKSLVLVGGSVTSTDSAVTLAVQIWDGGTGSVIKSKRWQFTQPVNTAKMSDDLANYLNTQLLQYLRMLAHRRNTRSPEGWSLFNRAWQYYRNSIELADNAEFEAGFRALRTADSLAAVAERSDEDWIAPTLLRVQVAQRAMTWSRHPASKRTPAEVKSWAEAAIAQGDRALERAPGNIDALELRGIAKYDYWTYLAGEQTRDDHALLRSAERDLQAVASADGQRALARVYLADIFHARAQFKEEKAMALLALDADPISARDPRIIYRVAIASFYLDQANEALRMCREGQGRYPDYVPFRFCELFVLAHADRIAPDVPRAWQIVNDLAQPASAPHQRAQVPLFQMLAANVIARADLRDSAQAVILRAATEAPGSVSLMAPEAAAWTRLGQFERAIDILERSAAIDPVWIKAVLLNPTFAPLRGQPRFQKLMDKFVRSRAG